MIIVKFGGSVITTEQRDDLFDVETATRLAAELRDARDEQPCIVVHGTGVVGKPPAERHGFAGDGVLPREQRHLALQIRRRLRVLNQKMVGVLLDAGIDAIPIDGMVGFDMNSEVLVTGALRSRLALCMEESVLPVCYGDMLPLANGGFRVFSSDEIMVALTRIYRPRQVLFLTDVDGVFADGVEGETSPRVLKRVTPSSIQQVHRSDRDDTDVSGGMQAKLASAFECARHAGRCVIAGGRRPGVLATLLQGGNPDTCTLVSA